MKAALLRRFAEPLQTGEVPDPSIRGGAVIVRVQAAFVPGAMIELTRGHVSWALPRLPYIPGADAVGVIEEVGPDVNGLEVGQAVYCDDYVTLAGAPTVGAYVGLLGTLPGADAVLAQWPNGCFAEKVLLPAECITPLGSAQTMSPQQLARLGYIGTSYHAIRRGNFEPGHVAIVNGATGVLGVGSTWLLLAFGASRVVAIGRRKETLERLHALDPKRVTTVEWEDHVVTADTLIEAAGGRADLFIDAVGFTQSAASTLAGIGALGRQGHATLIGGVNAAVPISYATQMIGLQLTIRGSEWFPRSAIADLLRMAASGVLDFACFKPRAFSLEDAQAAVDTAAGSARGFEHVVITPNT
jgi:alcohol dehydrogenase